MAELNKDKKSNIVNDISNTDIRSRKREQQQQPQQDFIPTSKRSLMEEVWLSVFTPGLNSRMVIVMNSVFICLFVSLAFLLFVSGFNIHVVFLSIIAVCLFLSVQWCVSNYDKI